MMKRKGYCELDTLFPFLAASISQYRRHEQTYSSTEIHTWYNVIDSDETEGKGQQAYTEESFEMLGESVRPFNRIFVDTVDELGKWGL